MATVPTRGEATLYGRIGDAFAYLCLLALVGLTTYALIRGRRTVAVSRPVSV